jgi:hypothetical protein
MGTHVHQNVRAQPQTLISRLPPRQQRANVAIAVFPVPIHPIHLPCPADRNVMASLIKRLPKMQHHARKVIRTGTHACQDVWKFNRSCILRIYKYSIISHTLRDLPEAYQSEHEDRRLFLQKHLVKPKSRALTPSRSPHGTYRVFSTLLLCVMSP